MTPRRTLNGAEKTAILEEVKVDLREFVERIFEERDRLYEVKFQSLDDKISAGARAVDVALTASKEQTSAAFVASEKAILKTEEAQKSYNATHNDLTRKMENQYKEMLPRQEAAAEFKAIDTAIGALRVSSGKETGSHERSHELWGYMIGILGIIVAGLAIIGPWLRAK